MEKTETSAGVTFMQAAVQASATRLAIAFAQQP